MAKDLGRSRMSLMLSRQGAILFSLQEQELQWGTLGYVQLAHFLSFSLEVSDPEKQTLSYPLASLPQLSYVGPACPLQCGSSF